MNSSLEDTSTFINSYEDSSFIDDSLVIDDSLENIKISSATTRTPGLYDSVLNDLDESGQQNINLPITPKTDKSFTSIRTPAIYDSDETDYDEESEEKRYDSPVQNKEKRSEILDNDGHLNEILNYSKKSSKNCVNSDSDNDIVLNNSSKNLNESFNSSKRSTSSKYCFNSDSDNDAELNNSSKNLNESLNSAKRSTSKNYFNSDSDNDVMNNSTKNINETRNSSKRSTSSKKCFTSDSDDDIVLNNRSKNLNETLNSSERSTSPKKISGDSDDEQIRIVKISKKKSQIILSDSEEEIVLSSNSPSPNPKLDCIDLTNDIEEIKRNKESAAIKQLNKSVFKQSTLDSMIIKIESPVNNSQASSSKLFNPPVNKDVIYCTQREYTDQATKVANIRTDLKRTKLLQSTINKDNLPDKGLSLMTRQLQLEKALQTEDMKLNKMIVETEDIKDLKPNMPVPWEQLQAGSSAVIPRTWGKQALQTHQIQKSLTMDKLKDLHGSLATCPAEDVLSENPKNLRIELMPHQKHALAWLSWREKQKPSGGILADDMGLGKTLTMISLVLKSKQDTTSESEEEKENESEWQSKSKPKKLVEGGTLVICPASLLKQWESEVHSKCKRNSLSVEVYHGNNRESKPKSLAKEDIIITTYNLAMRECQKRGPLYQIKWKRVILDEAHIVRNYKSQTSVAVCSIHAKSRWALTGTPVHNKELDLYALLKFLQCSPFDDLVVWKRWVVNKNAGGQDRLNTVMKTIMLRRTKVQLQNEGGLKNLPEKKFELIEVKLDKSEVQVYQKVLIFSRTLFAQFLHQRAEKNTDLQYNQLSGKPEFLKQMDPNSEYYKMHKKMLKIHGTSEVKSHQILVLLLRLRQICCHPSLIVGMLDKESIEDEGIEEDGIDIDIMDKLNKLDLADDEDEFVPNNQVEENLNKAASKLLSTCNEVFNMDRKNEKIRQLLKIIQEKVIPNGDKAVVVSQWTSMLRVVLYHFKEAGIKCDMLDGSVPVIKRNEIVENFNNPKHSMKVLLLSLTAGGVGLNLIGGNHLILLDLHWNPQLESQAQDRIYRVGQTKTVVIYKLLTLDTIEERIKALQDNKLQMASDILSGTKAMPGSKLTLEDLKMLFSI